MKVVLGAVVEVVQVGVGLCTVDVIVVSGGLGVIDGEISGVLNPVGRLQLVHISIIDMQMKPIRTQFFFIFYRPFTVSVILTVIQS